MKTNLLGKKVVKLELTPEEFNQICKYEEEINGLKKELNELKDSKTIYLSVRDLRFKYTPDLTFDELHISSDIENKKDLLESEFYKTIKKTLDDSISKIEVFKKELKETSEKIESQNELIINLKKRFDKFPFWLKRIFKIKTINNEFPKQFRY